VICALYLLIDAVIQSSAICAESLLVVISLIVPVLGQTLMCVLIVRFARAFTNTPDGSLCCSSSIMVAVERSGYG
jgi:hypothetical protein